MEFTMENMDFTHLNKKKVTNWIFAMKNSDVTNKNM